MKKPKKKTPLTPAEWLSREHEPQDPLLGDLFTTSSRILLAAETGAGKTMFGIACAFAMTLGEDFLRWKSKRQARVLYIDGEMPIDLMMERIALACDWFDVDPPEEDLIILSREDYEDMPPLDTEEGQDWLDEKIDRLGPFDFIIFDNLMALCTSVMKEEDSWLKVKEYVLSLTRRQIGQLWVHHTGHEKGRSYGTKTREWQMDTVIIGEIAEKSLSASMKLTFSKTRRRKPRNWSDFEDVIVEIKGGEWVHRKPDDDVASGRPNRSEGIAMDALRTAIAQHGGSDVSHKLWKAKAIELGISESTKKTSQEMAFKRARRVLVASGEVIKRENKYSPRDDGGTKGTSL